MFRKTLVLFIFCLFYYQAKEIVGYDWSNHFGYTNINGNIMWNTDWNAGPFFFDGTWSANPGIMGPYIKNMFLNVNFDTAKIENNKVSSNFDYIQGDYLRDELSVSLKNFNSNKNFLDINGFKRSYAGIYNQYTPSGSFPKPIHQTYTIHFERNKKNEQVGIAIGHFNTLSAIPVDKDISWKALYDSRITSSNIFWSKKYNYFDINLKNYHFLQRFYSNYYFPDTTLSGIYNSSPSTDFEYLNSVRYLNRQKREIVVDLNNKSNFRFNFYFEFNSRKIKKVKTTPVRWENFSLGIKYNKNSYLRIGSNFSQKQKNIIYELEHNRKWNNVQIKLFSKKNVFPPHPYFGQLTKISSLSSSQIEISLSFSNFRLFNWVAYNHHVGPLIFNEELENYDDFNINLGSQLNWHSNQFYKLSIKFLHNQNGHYLNDGVKNKLSIVSQYNLKAFKSVLDLNLKMAITGWWNRQPVWYLHPIESVPVSIANDGVSDDIWFIDFSISAAVSSFTITYKWKNLSSYLERLGYNEFANNLYFHPLMPEVGSLNSLKITWEFLN